MMDCSSQKQNSRTWLPRPSSSEQDRLAQGIRAKLAKSHGTSWTKIQEQRPHLEVMAFCPLDDYGSCCCNCRSRTDNGLSCVLRTFCPCCSLKLSTGDGNRRLAECVLQSCSETERCAVKAQTCKGACQQGATSVLAVAEMKKTRIAGMCSLCSPPDAWNQKSIL